MNARLRVWGSKSGVSSVDRKADNILYCTSMRDSSFVEEAQSQQSLFYNGFRKSSRKPFRTRIRVEVIGYAVP